MITASEVVGFLGSGLVLLTFAMHDMRWLRTMAIFSNVAFILYGALNLLLPVLALHVLLLPLNVLRLSQSSTTRADK